MGSGTHEDRGGLSRRAILARAGLSGSLRQSGRSAGITKPGHLELDRAGDQGCRFDPADGESSSAGPRPVSATDGQYALRRPSALRQRENEQSTDWSFGDHEPSNWKTRSKQTSTAPASRPTATAVRMTYRPSRAAAPARGVGNASAARSEGNRANSPTTAPRARSLIISMTLFADPWRVSTRNRL